MKAGNIDIRAGPGHSSTTMNVNPRTNYGQYAESGGEIANTEGGRTSDSLPNMVPRQRPNPQRYVSLELDS